MAGPRYKEVTVSADGRVIGRLPFIVRSRPGGRRSCEMPPLTHFLGPAVDEGGGSAPNRALKRAQIIRELLEQLPPVGAFRQRMHRGIQETMVFQENGFQSLADFTFEIAPAEEGVIWKGMRDKTRNMIRRAGERYTVTNLDDPEVFADFYQRNIQERGEEFYYCTPDITRLCYETAIRNQGRVLVARTGDGAPVAAIFYVWDARSAYYLLSTRVRDSDNSAVSLLLWEAIRHTTSLGLIFDFDGVASHGSRVFFTGFGGEIRPRYVISRETPFFRASTIVADRIKALRRRLGR